MNIEGKVFEIITRSDKVWEIVIRKKHKEKIIPISFIAFSHMISCVKELNIKPKDRIKIQFHLISKMFSEKYYTSAVVDKIDMLQRDMGTSNMFHNENASNDYDHVDMETGEIFENGK